MYPRGAAPRGRSAYSNGPFPSNPGPRFYDYNHLSSAGVNSFNVRGLENLSPYKWKPPPSTSPVPPPYAAAMTNRRKRQHEEYSPDVVKRQRLDSSSQPRIGSPLIRAPPPLPLPLPLPPCLPGQVVAGSSRPSFPGFDRSYPHPHSQPRPQVLAVPVSPNSLEIYAKDKLSVQMVELFEACQQQMSDLTWKERCRARLQQDIQRVYAAARLYLTGSSMNGLGCRSSDADLCLIVRGKKTPNPIHVLTGLQRFFQSLSYVDRTQLIRAKVPILRFKDRDSNLEFDLNINNTVGIRNTFLLRSYAYADLRIRPMILVVKKWAGHHQINDASKGTLSSYTLVLLVLHYLQTRHEPVLPSLQRDHPECFSPFLDVDVIPEGPKHIPPYVSRNQSSLGELLLGFLKYYATDFRWDNMVISVREARALPKTNSKEWRNKYLCVEEPFERNNVARAVHEKIKFNAIKAQFAESFRILRERKDLNSILPVRAIINKETAGR